MYPLNMRAQDITSKRSPVWTEATAKDREFPRHRQWTNEDYPGWVIVHVIGGYNAYAPHALVLALDTPRARRYHERLRREQRAYEHLETTPPVAFITNQAKFAGTVRMIEEILDGPEGSAS